MNIANWLYSSAQMYSNKPALLVGDIIVANYAQFAKRAASIAASLRSVFGIEEGDHIGIFMKNRIEYLEVLYAIWWLGCVTVPINAKLHKKEAKWILDDAEAKLVVVSNDIKGSEDYFGINVSSGMKTLSVDSLAFKEMYLADSISCPVSRNSDDLAWLFYTSGTTGRPKGAMLSNANLIAMSLCYPVDVDTVSSSDAALYAAPISHGAGLYNFIHVRYGARHVVPPSGGFDGDEVLSLAKNLKNVTMFAAPTMVKRLTKAARARRECGDGIKTVVYGGGPMYLDDIEMALDQMGSRFVQIYGQGESPMTISVLARGWHNDKNASRYQERLSSVGIVQSAVQVRVTDGNGEQLPFGEIGNIEVKGLTVMLGYWKQPEATKNTIKDGWLCTGDLGSIDEDGFLTLWDRSKDVVISGGSNIYPREVEEVLLTHPDVKEVSVVGRPDPEWGEIVVACVVIEIGKQLNTDALDELCMSSIARFKKPKLYLCVDDLPKNNNGKVLKSELRASVESLLV